MKGREDDIKCKADWAFLLDESSSMKDEQFEEEKDFLLALITALNPRKDGAHAAILTFSQFYEPDIYPPIKHNFSSPQEIDYIANIVTNLTQPSDNANTFTHLALEWARDYIFKEENGMRDSPIPKNIVIITDGVCDCGDYVLTDLAEEFKKLDIRIVAVGVQGIDVATIEELSENLKLLSNESYIAEEFTDLKPFVEKVSYCSGNQ